MTTFKIGDQVRYVGNRRVTHSKVGLVIGCDDEFVRVNFGGTATDWAALASNLELVADAKDVRIAALEAEVALLRSRLANAVAYLSGDLDL